MKQQTKPIPNKIHNFQTKSVVPFNIETSSNNEMMEQQLKKLRESILRTEGNTCEPNKPRIVDTRKNILIPPPIPIEYFDLLNQQEVKKDMPLIANNVMKAPKLRRAREDSEISTPVILKIEQHIKLVAVVSKNIPNRELTRNIACVKTI